MKKYYIAILTIILMLSFTSIAMAATDQQDQDGMNVLRILLCMVLLAICGIVSSRKGKIVLFANYTDISYTAGVVFIPLAIGIILSIMIGDKISDGRYIFYSSLAIGIITSLAVLKATYMYNRGYKHNILLTFFAYTSKISMLILFILAIVWAFCAASNSRNKRSYESDSDHQTKANIRGVLGVAAASGIFLFLSKLGVSKPGFVSFKEYINGQQIPEFNKQESNKMELYSGGGF